jgi:hypothetical protein
MNTIINSIKTNAFNGKYYTIINNDIFVNNDIFSEFIVKNDTGVTIIEWSTNNNTSNIFYNEIVNITQNANYYKNIKNNIISEINKLIKNNQKISYMRIFSLKEKEIIFKIIKNIDELGTFKCKNIKLNINENIYCKWAYEQFDELVIMIDF